VRAVEMQIHNFRSVLDATIQLESLSLAAGANNSGKSNLIDAIRVFYADLKWDENRDLPKIPTSDEESWVEIEFRPTDDELSQLKDEYKGTDGSYRVRNYFRSAPGPDGKARAGYYAYEQEQLSDNLFYGAKNVGSAKVGHIVYIPAVGRVEESTKLTGPSVLRDLVSEVLTKVVANSVAYQDLTKAFGTFEGEIKTVTGEDGQSLQTLESEVTSEIESWDASFSLGIQSIQPEDIVKSLVKPLLTDETHGGEIDQARFGAGFQRHLIFTLIKIAARHANPAKAPAGTKKEFSPQLTWILFEEPEAFLHPSQEEVLHDSLLELVKDGATQVLLTTHSSRFVSRSMNDLTRLVCVRRDQGVTSSHQVSQSQLDTLFDDALVADDTITPIGTAPEDLDKAAMMGALKTELWLQASRTTAFFAQRAILVEGQSEVALYSFLTTRGRMVPPVNGLAVIDCMGKFNLHRFVALLDAFGVDHSVLYDGDSGQKHDAEVTAAIDGAKGSFTRRVTRFPVDLETELGITPLSRSESHRKPQYVLYQLETGAVDPGKLDLVMKEFSDLATAAPEETK